MDTNIRKSIRKIPRKIRRQPLLLLLTLKQTHSEEPTASIPSAPKQNTQPLLLLLTLKKTSSTELTASTTSALSKAHNQLLPLLLTLEKEKKTHSKGAYSIHPLCSKQNTPANIQLQRRSPPGEGCPAARGRGTSAPRCRCRHPPRTASARTRYLRQHRSLRQIHRSTAPK